MQDKDIRKAFEGLNPTEEQKLRLKSQIESEKFKMTHHRRRFHPVAVAASICLAILIAGTGVNAATGGAIVTFLEGLFTPSQVKDDIVAQVAGVPLAGVEVYAPQIFEVSNDRIVFGTDRGIVVYDRDKEAVSTTLDLMAIDSFFFNGDKRDTHIIVDEDKIAVYNLTNGVPDGVYYEFLIVSGEEGTLLEYQSVDNSVAIEQLEERWQKEHKEYFKEAFYTFCETEPVEKSDYGLGYYSQELFSWSGGESIIYIDEANDFYLYTITDSGQELKEFINLGDLRPSTTKLPGYVNDGEDKIMVAVKARLIEEVNMYYTSEGQDTVCIPVADIVRIEEESEETLVYGAYKIYNYVRVGNTLETVSGGSMPGLMHLVKQGDGYKVVDFEIAADGGDYTESIEKMCAPYPGLAEEFMAEVSKGDDDLLQSEIEAYVENTDLSKEILYYKAFGWDPVKLRKQ